MAIPHPGPHPGPSSQPYYAYEQQEPSRPHYYYTSYQCLPYGPPSALPKQVLMPPLQPSPAAAAPHTPLPTHTPPPIFPVRSNSLYALTFRRPDVLAAAAVTVHSAARPPRSFWDLTAPRSPLQSPVSQSSVTTTTSTSPHTPIPTSPSSSVTSLSLPAKSSPSNISASPAASVASVVTDPPLKKSWASLLRPPSSDSHSLSISSTANSLPTSSVQGFSVPATPSTPTKPSGPPAALVALLTGRHIHSDPEPPLRPRGLVNLGNMCFANTVLQVLAFCPPFYHLFVELPRIPRGEGVRPTPLIDATVTLMKEFQVPPNPQDEDDVGRDAFVPTFIYDALKEKKRFDSMRGGQQEDAEEFLGFYLDTLEEELLSMIAGVKPLAPSLVKERAERDTSPDEWVKVGKKNKSVVMRTHKSLDSPISRIFGGRFRTTLRVPGARESIIVDPWSRLQLDIQPDHVHTIEDALLHSATPGTVQVARPGSQVDASQQTLIDALPPVLVLHLKRFLYDRAVGDVVKLRKRVAFGTELDVPKEAMAPTRPVAPHKYKLFGVLNHHGSSATGGHYTLDVLHPHALSGWLRIDDELVQQVQEEDLLAHDAGYDRTAYLLFYQRIARM